MTFEQFLAKYMGKTVGYPNGQFVGECLSLAKWYIKECFGFDPPPSGSNSAYGYWSNFPTPLDKYFTKVANTPDGVPNRGDIIIWNTNAGGGYGHIAIFLEGTASSFKSLDQNWGGKETHVQGHYYTNVVGWLTPIMPENTDLQTILDHFHVKDAKELIDMVDREFGYLADARTKVSDLESNIEQRAKAIAQRDRDDTDYFDSLVVTLSPDIDKYKGMTSREIVKLEVESFIKRESELQKQVSDAEKSKAEEIRQLKETYERKITEFEKKLTVADEQIESLKLELKAIKDTKPPQTVEKPEMGYQGWFTGLIKSIKSALRRLLWWSNNR